MTFADGFLFGAATSAYQVEGAVREAGRGLSIWDTFSHSPGRTLHGDTGDIACDHYHRLDADLDIVAELGLNAYRFSIAWPRVMPDGKTVNPHGLDFYERLVDGLMTRGIAAMATLYHWDLPQDLEDRGGWRSRETAARLADFADVVGRRLGDRVAHWITLNEPWVSSFVGHLEGRHAPGFRDLGAALTAAHHLLLGHGLAFGALKAAGAVSAGVTINMSDVHAASDDQADIDAAARIDGQVNRWFLDPLRRGSYPADMLEWYAERADLPGMHPDDLRIISVPTDFLGINFYERAVVAHDPTDPIHQARRLPVPEPVTALGDAIRPETLRDVLLRVNRDYGGPAIFVTENGAAFHDYVDPEGRVRDHERVEYLRGYLSAVEEAIDAGADVRGYCVWSLLDNFEWALGYSTRFGLVYVDYATQRRIVKESGRFFGAFARANRGVG